MSKKGWKKKPCVFEKGPDKMDQDEVTGENWR